MPYLSLDDLVDKGVEFGPEGIPTQWKPSPERFPNVVLDPHFSFGSPVVVPGFIPTATLYEAVLAEGDEEAAAGWYGVDPSIVRQAVTFELDVVQ